MKETGDIREPIQKAVYQEYRTLLFSVAYRMLGSVTDAEDIIQDVFTDFEKMPLDEIRNWKTYLTKTVTNRCLNFLQSARKKREVYTGQWLPEPDIRPLLQNPLDELVQTESVSYALLVLMEVLLPAERAVFVLKEAFGLTHREIAEILDKSEAGCRQLYSRAKRKLPSGSGELSISADLEKEKADELAKAFLLATKTGKFSGILNQITEDTLLISDGGGKVRAAIFPIKGRRRIQAFFEGITRKGFYEKEIRLLSINGMNGLLLSENGIAKCILCFGTMPDCGKINRIFMLLNPDKLSHINPSTT